MDYQSTLDYIFNITPSFQNIGSDAYKPGLSRTLKFAHALNNPHESYKIIHVGGTNGKGSTSHMLAAILQSAGYKVGLYTSPHLCDFRERMRVNGCEAEKDYVINFVNEHKDIIASIGPSFFELTTLMAFEYFKRKKVDVAIIEVGLGGRLDSTNILSPILSIITNVSVDHTQYLGNTISAIAYEKAGIMKKNVPTLIGEWTDETKKVFERVAFEKQAVLKWAGIHIESSWTEENARFYNTTSHEILKTDLVGEYQIKNLNTVLSALPLLNDFTLPAKAVKAGLENVCKLTGLKGRWQTISHHPLIICDTAHNVGGWQYIAKALSVISQNKRLYIMMGMVTDKEIEQVVSMLPASAHYLWTQAKVKRAMEAHKLKDLGDTRGLIGASYPSIDGGLKHIIPQLSPTDVLFIGGSNFVVAEALDFFEHHKNESTTLDSI